MIDCKSCGMNFDENEYDICPYCGEALVAGMADSEGTTPEEVVTEKKSEKPVRKEPEAKKPPKEKAAGSKLKYVLLGLVAMVIIAAAVTAMYTLDGSSVTVPDKYATIQEAIDAAADGDVIVVAEGVYRENVDFRGKNIVLRSTDPDDPAVVSETIIDGRGGGAVVTFRSGEGEGAVLSGFSITRGGGILISGGSTPLIEKCIIEDNSAEIGAGIAIFDSSPSIVGNTIVGNSGFLGGGLFIEESSPLIEGNTIVGNRAEMGSGIVIYSNSSPTVIDNIIADNTATRLGGGLFVAFNSKPIIKGNTIAGNYAERNGGGILIEESDPVIEDNRISKNAAANGGGICIVSSLNMALLIANNTIDDNLAYIAGGGIYMEGSSPTVEGNTFSDNVSEFLGGAAAVNNSSPLFRRNKFENNQADDLAGGGAIWYSADSVLGLSDPDDNTYLLNIPDDLLRE